MSRPLRQDEKLLVIDLLGKNEECLRVIENLDHYNVEDMADGGMGSVRVVSSRKVKRKATRAASASYVDSDAVVVSVQINLDQNQELYEIDIWKTDFSKLILYPSKNTKQ